MIETILSKHGFNDSKINKHYLNILQTIPQNEWFFPTNKEDEKYTILNWFASRGLICEKKIPNFSKGSYYGMRNFYYWNDKLDYDNVV